MRGQEITPWSIYNQTIHREEEQPSQQGKYGVRFPKIQKGITHRHRQEELLHFKRRHSAMLGYEKFLEKKEEFIPYSSEFPQRAGGSRETEIQQKQLQIGRLLEECVIVRLVKEQLKREASEIDFLRILQEEPVEQPAPALQIIKKERSLLLDHHAFPRISIERNMMLVNLKEGGDSVRDELSQDDIRQLLKNEISSMISNRMKIMGKAKEIKYKN